MRLFFRSSGVFSDVFTLCLYWQVGDVEELSRRFSTVNAVMRTLRGLDVITELTYREYPQRLDLLSELGHRVACRDKTTATMADALLISTSRLMMAGDHPNGVSGERLLTRSRIYLTDEGCLYAARLEASGRFAASVTREVYVAERLRMKAQFESLSETTQRSILANFHRRHGRQMEESELGEFTTE